MDPRLLRFYNEELTYLRESAREFGEEHETVAGRLGLKTPNDPDPYVERLLEGVAFLSARVQLKLSDQYPEFTQHLLSAVQPHYLAPVPAICIAGFEPKEGDPLLAEGYVVPRQTELVATSDEAGASPVTFRTGHAVKLYPLKISEVEYLGSRTAVASFAASAGTRAEAGLRLRFEGLGNIPLEKLKITDLPIYLDGSETIPGELYRQIIGDTVAVLARPAASASATPVSLPMPTQAGFEKDEALLPAEERSFRGYRLLTEYFACPERFLFAVLQGLDKAFAQADGGAIDIVLLFNRNAPALVGALSPANFRLFATPAINLFEKQLGRVQVNGADHEFLLMPDRTRPLDFEVWRILDVSAHLRDSTDARPVAPLYALGALLYDWRDALFFVPRLKLRRLSTREQRRLRREDYTGTETWISLTAAGNPERIADIKELAVRALVTNRELASKLAFRGTEHFVPPGGPVRAVSILRSPSRPRPPLGLDDAAWRIIAHLTPNYATLVPEDGNDPSMLRDHLALYGPRDNAALRRQIDGIVSVNSRAVVRRVPGRGAMAVARGSRITMTLDDASFENARLFLFSAVVERFLAEFTSVNSFTETIVRTPGEGTIMSWPPRIGRKHTI
ncbi:MAG: type VI secretion protein [Novosphingobium sp. 28-62-57]|uniref:type VI secretion system baseplate subunit TssF n=1 Tax=unclassified Novosphingobium TaxID=2644732 RepID=UPI000BCF1F81|nr:MULTISPECIES: type VI secretion system baseplate subunit TssF [unclassified Novosphingobium]OYW47875.1 MAG: type VI secretion protein [Novosphingobium sp. 12-63-9]OYZ10768.1 MAG: type VI secretion protein [Novosphingobium sp. 28-62-57]HQS68966.1 type VI secretion system baseplate subunit TssF [Novosphingobium sp.]